LLKVNSSERAIETVLSALQACGLSGYRNDGEFSVARNLRDVLSSSIMINNERIFASAASSLLLFEVPALVRDSDVHDPSIHGTTRGHYRVDRGSDGGERRTGSDRCGRGSQRLSH